MNGVEHPYAASVSYLALSIWAYEELAHGVNWFRRLLGFGIGDRPGRPRVASLIAQMKVIELGASWNMVP
jgi:hypothetical protein